ncbi:hypothetical protein AB9T89_00310 [Flavobacterium oncorhynchi]|uniref:hypothetical protein n=1 Tax=Flavobacterium oncorhynchi TaxID=728056 RepID=UPI00351A422F
MNLKYLLFLLLLISCQKPKPETQLTSTTAEPKTETTAAKEHFLKTDTISISEGEENSKTNFILAHLLNQTADKDSIVTSKYRLDFYVNKTKVTDSKISINGVDKGSEWGATYGLNSTASKNSPFVRITFGYPACGYSQNNYLFYLKNSDLQLVHEWDSMLDGGWGSWVEFDNPNAKSNPESFYCKTVTYFPEDDNDDMGTVSHYDSIAFRLTGNHWKKQLVSTKDKVYFEKKVSFDEFHKRE